MTAWMNVWLVRLRTPLRVFTTTAIIMANLWAVAALAIDVRIAWLRVPLALLLVGVVIAIYWRCGRRWLAPALATGCFVVVLSWWLMLTPSNDHAWQANVALLPSAEINDQHITIHGIRSCDYRSEFDYDVHHHDQTVALADLRTADLFLVYWGSPSIAHTMISFGFSDGTYLCFSIEARMEIGEAYSAIRGFFRQFEIIYLVADEQDLVRLRTNFRQGEEVYLYHLKMTQDEIRGMLLDYLRRVNQLQANPEWYHAVASNCTTAIRAQRASSDRSAWDWRILLNGHLDEWLYEQGFIDTSMPFPELKQHALINPRARSVGPSDNFSQRIRQGITTGLP